MKPTANTTWATLSNWQQGLFYMHHPIDRIAHTTGLNEKIAQWVHREGLIKQPITPWVDALPWSEISLLAQVEVGQGTVVASAMSTGSKHTKLPSTAIQSASGDWLDHFMPLNSDSQFSTTSVFLREEGNTPGPLQAFSGSVVPASVPRLVHQRRWYVLSCLWDGAYKSTLTVKSERVAYVAAAGFLSHYQNGP